MAEALRLCSLTVRRSQLPASGTSDSAAAGEQTAWADAGGRYFGGYELLLEQDLEDGLYHEPHESGATLRLQVRGRVGAKRHAAGDPLCWLAQAHCAGLEE